jgi:hypothetical protein
MEHILNLLTQDGIISMWPAIIALAIAATMLPIRVWIGIIASVIVTILVYSFIWT